MVAGGSGWRWGKLTSWYAEVSNIVWIGKVHCHSLEKWDCCNPKGIPKRSSKMWSGIVTELYSRSRQTTNNMNNNRPRCWVILGRALNMLWATPRESVSLRSNTFWQNSFLKIHTFADPLWQSTFGFGLLLFSSILAFQKCYSFRFLNYLITQNRFPCGLPMPVLGYIC